MFSVVRCYVTMARYYGSAEDDNLDHEEATFGNVTVKVKRKQN